METATYRAIQALVENNINKLPVSSLDIRSMIEKQGFRIVSYSKPINDSKARDFKELGLLDTANNYKAFTYADKNHKFVFYRSTLSEQERNRLLAHELGHIYLGHLEAHSFRCSSGLDCPQEREAEEFALELLAPTCILKKMGHLSLDDICHITLVSNSDAKNIFFKLQSSVPDNWLEQRLCNTFGIKNDIVNRNTNKHFSLMVAVITGLCLLFFSAVSTGEGMPDSLVERNISPTPTTQADAYNSVVVTPHGKKYHVPNCRHVKNSETFSLTIAEAIEKGYGPCNDCIKQDYLYELEEE